jgi:low affinity Fe/Cu permease
VTVDVGSHGWAELISGIARRTVAAAGSTAITVVAVGAMATWMLIGVMRGFNQHWRSHLS